MTNTTNQSNRNSAHHQNKGQRQNHNNRNNAPLKADSAYNFVPVSENIVFTHSRTSQDWPLKQGLSGTLEIECINTTPLTIGDTRKTGTQEKAGLVSCFDLPHKHNDKKEFAIPGSSIKGAIRSIYEVLGFAKLSQVQDQRFGIRDLQFDHYQKRFAKSERTKDGKFVFHSKVKTGWIKFTDGKWQFTPCLHWRIEQDDIAKSNLIKDRKENDWYKMAKMTSSKKYELIKPHSLKVNFVATQAQNQPHNNKSMFYAKLSQLNNSGADQGYLILTGQPGDRIDKRTGKKRNNTKHMEFIFGSPSLETADSSTQVQKLAAQFLKTYKGTNELKVLQKLHKSNDLPAIPVFYIEEDRKVHSFGLSQLYKLAADYSIHDTIKSINHEHLGSKKDIVENLFGFLREDSNSDQKGRVSFGLMTSNDAQIEQTERTVLLGPRATYYPFYLEQPKAKANNTIAKENWVSYLKPLGQQSKVPKIRGRKYYPVKNISIPNPPTNINSEKTVLKLEYVKPNTKFIGKIRIHNLSEIELGGLLWALTLNDEQTPLQLGMAKSFGFGQVQLNITNLNLNHNEPHQHLKTMEEYRSIFEDYMNQQVPNWKNTSSVQSLLNILNKDKMDRFAQNHKMQLKPLDAPMKFSKLKGDKGNPRRNLPETPGQVLPPIIALKPHNNENHSKSDKQTPDKISNSPFAGLKK